MALSLSGMETRIDNSLKLLGSQSSTIKEQNISDAVAKFISKMDVPLITSAVSVLSGDKTYSIPADIRKIQDIRDADGDSHNYTIDATSRQFILQTAPTANETYTVYGTPDDVRTNLDAIIASIPTSYEYILWAYIIAMSYEWANEDTASGKMQKADFMANEERRSKNLSIGSDFVTMQTFDSDGRLIADGGNAEGFNVDIDGLYQSDL